MDVQQFSLCIVYLSYYSWIELYYNSLLICLFKKMLNACDEVPRQLLERLLNLKGFWVRGLGRLEELICPSGIHKQPSLARRLKGHFHVN